MKYYKVIHDYDNGKAELSFKENSSIGGFPSVSILLNNGTSFDYICSYSLDDLSDFPNNRGSYFLVSKELLQIIERFSREINIVDSKIIESDSNLYKTYYIIYIDKEIKVIDEKETTYIEIIEQYRRERYVDSDKCVLKADKIKNKDIFRVEDLNGYYIISERLKKAIELSNMTGIKFEIIKTS